MTRKENIREDDDATHRKTLRVLPAGPKKKKKLYFIFFIVILRLYRTSVNQRKLLELDEFKV